jgi:hypothetical protein
VQIAGQAPGYPIYKENIMNKKTLGGILLVVGLVVIVGGLVLMLVIVPGMKQFPDDVDTTRLYAGTMPVLLAPQPDGSITFLTDLEVNLERHFYTEEVDGDLALVVEEQTLSTGGQPLKQLLKRQAIDRKSMEFVDEIPAKWADKEGIYQRDGIVLGWPIDTEKKDYDGWSDDYRTIVPLEFDSEVEHPRAKIDTYLFTSASDAQPIVPEQVEELGLPPAIPQETLSGLISGMEGMSPLMGTAFPLLMSLAEWPNPVPLEYTYEYTGEYWIEPTTGVLIDTHKVEVRKVTVPEDLLTALVDQIDALPVPVESEVVSELLPLTVYYLDYQATDQTVEDAKKDAEDAKDRIKLYGSTLPIVGIVAGLVIGVVGLFLVMQKSG